jgi:mRNA interferase RelE/StbE
MNDLEKAKDKHILKRVKEVVTRAKSAESIEEIKDLNALHDYKTCHRINLGEYQIGIQVEKQKLIFVRLIHRKDIYRYFT